MLQTDYIYRGISYSAHQPSIGAYVDVQQGWLYAWTNSNSVNFSTRPAVEMTMALGVRPVYGAFEFDFGSAYYYYPGELGPDLSNYWESHATVSHKLTDKLTLGATLAYAPDVWQTGAWGTYAAGAGSLGGVCTLGGGTLGGCTPGGGAALVARSAASACSSRAISCRTSSRLLASGALTRYMR